MNNIESLIPQRKHLIFDILQGLDFDMADWSDSLKSDSPPSSNPKYCFNWSFIREDNQLIVLNLWHEELVESNGIIFQEHKFKEFAAITSEKKRRNRALAIDQACRTAYQQNIPVRVVICKGDIANGKVHKRELDNEVWAITGYDLVSGATIIQRGVNPTNKILIDQFDLDRSNSTPIQYERNGVTYVRSSFVRHKVLMRANGNCEFCGKQGFTTNNGDNYLETHHITPLAENGPDSIKNVIALCSEDHRKAHFEKNTLLTRENLYSIVKQNIEKQLVKVVSQQLLCET
ncbi:HNH endonuclease [Thalassotalea sp. G2M2-11]|uniref:HNH endonuclease n=1 Tax=Thalassotalea sp. G2M2-11 TaxID=2787627 RepID=UPI0019D0A5EA|nr:HNH endonuclease [Thalassotalea sp. G2M2-11]